MGNLVDPVWNPVQLDPKASYSFLQVSYAGYAEEGETRLGSEVSYKHISTAQAGDIIISNISAVYRAICVLPKWGEKLLLSSEFTILRIKDKNKLDPDYLWSVLRSSAVIAEWLSGATGVGRRRVDWDRLQHQRIPLLGSPEQKEVGKLFRRAEAFKARILQLEASALGALAPLELEGQLATDRLARAKPPK